jgi:hypothetical protein
LENTVNWNAAAIEWSSRDCCLVYQGKSSKLCFFKFVKCLDLWLFLISFSYFNGTENAKKNSTFLKGYIIILHCHFPSQK